MTTTVNVNQLLQSGRLTAPDPASPRVALTHNADLSGAVDFEIDLRTINQQQQFGIIRALFMDNGSNPSAVEISVSGSDQFFTVPPYAQGVFSINAVDNSVIKFVSAGGATDIVTITVFNWEVPPQVWYSYGPTNNAEPIKVYGPMSPGDTIASEATNTPVFIGARDTSGIFRAIACDASGNLTMSGTISISSISIADGNDAAMGAKADAAVTNPASTASLIAIEKGSLTGINTLNTSLGNTSSSMVTAGGAGNLIGITRGIGFILGERGDAAVTSPGTNASITAYIRGMLTGINTTFANIATTNTNTGAPADAAVTNPASSGSIIAILKGILTGINFKSSSSTTTLSNVAGSAASVTVLASNANRKGATIMNDSTAILYLNLNASVASTTNYTVQIAAGGYYEIPFGYTGEIRGIWASATGNARVTEMT